MFFIDVRLASEGQKNRSLSNQLYADALQLTDDYKNARIEKIKDKNFYRITDGDFPPPFVLWHVLKIKPDKTATLPNALDDYYVANCNRAGGIKGNSSSCDYSLDIDGYLVRIRTTENNLHLKEKITAYAKSRLIAWKKNCE